MTQISDELVKIIEDVWETAVGPQHIYPDGGFSSCLAEAIKDAGYEIVKIERNDK